jgi:formate/nitrite transporter FocA (FNT family)
MKVVLLVMLAGVIVALASAGVFMLRRGDDDRGRQMARALAVRVGLSIALFLLILLSWRMGWIRPTGIPPGA